MTDEKEKQAKPVNRARILTRLILYEVLVFVGMYLSLRYLPVLLKNYTSLEMSASWKIGIVIGGTMLGMLICFVQIYFRWAPNNLYFTFIPEGRGKIVVKGDAFQKVLMQWKGHKLSEARSETNDEEKDAMIDIGDVIEGETRRGFFERLFERIFGGLKYYGFWPIKDIYIYDFGWMGIKQNGELDLHPKETLDYVLFKDDVYGALVDQAEDKELLPLDIRLALTLRVLNPYKALFNVQNWYEMVINRITPYVRDFVTTNTYQRFIQGKTRIDKGVMKRLAKEGILGELRNRYGVELRRIEIKDINPSEDSGNPIRKATIQKYLAAREGEKRAGETIGALINMMAEATGRSTKEVKKEIADSDELKKEFNDTSKDLIRRKMSIDGKSFTHIKVDGAEGIEQMLLNLLVASKKISQSEKPSTKEKEKPSTKGKEKASLEEN